ncbi:hypothetical protein AAG906_027970 [Vitis piasezkii]
MVPSCYHKFNVNYQGPRAPASSTSQTGPTPPAQTMMVAPSPASTDSWLLDSGTTHHLSHTAATIHNGTPYNGTNSMVVGNGKSLPITQVGHSFLHTPAKCFFLHNVLHVPLLTSNLISVSKFCTDNNTILEFHHSSFFVKDKDTKVTLLQGQLEPHLLASSKHQVFLTKTQPTTMLWHQRFGHLSAVILQEIFHTCNISYNSNKTVDVCNACCCAKSHKIHFSLSTSRASSPLELIHADLWGPAPIPSSTGARYFLLLMDDYSRPPLNAFKQTMVESSLPSPGFYLFMLSSGYPIRTCPHITYSQLFVFTPLIQVSFVDEAAEISTAPLQDSTTPIPSHPMITRSKFGICKKKTYLTSLIAEPRDLVMEQEYQALLKNQTWSLVPPPSNAKIIRCKWVFKLKHKPDGSIDRYKARLKALYDLKQAPRAWFHKLNSFLLQLGFQCSRTNASLFYFHFASDIIILLIYVDDILITGSNPPQVHHIISQLRSHFALRDLGDIITRLPHVLHLNQQRYIHQLLEHADLLGAKSVSTHAALGKLLSTANGEPLSALDATHYRSLVLLLMVFLSMPHHFGLFKWLLSFFFFFCTNLISWSSTKQRVVSRSSLCIPQLDTPLIWCDNIDYSYQFSATRTHLFVVLRPVGLRGDDRQTPASTADSSPL